jgi:choline dehydrogenase
MIDQTMTNISNEEERYDYIVVGAGAAGSVLAAELSASGAQVLVIESGGADDAPTIMKPSIWFYNVGGPLDYHLPVAPSPRLNNRKLTSGAGQPPGRAFRGHRSARGFPHFGPDDSCSLSPQTC